MTCWTRGTEEKDKRLFAVIHFYWFHILLPTNQSGLSLLVILETFLEVNQAWWTLQIWHFLYGPVSQCLYGKVIAFNIFKSLFFHYFNCPAAFKSLKHFGPFKKKKIRFCEFSAPENSTFKNALLSGAFLEHQNFHFWCKCGKQWFSTVASHKSHCQQVVWKGNYNTFRPFCSPKDALLHFWLKRFL